MDFVMNGYLIEIWNDFKYLFKRNKPPIPPLPIEIGKVEIHVNKDHEGKLNIDITCNYFSPDEIKPYLDDPTIKILRDLAYKDLLEKSEYRKTLNGYDKMLHYKRKMFDFEIDW